VRKIKLKSCFVTHFGRLNDGYVDICLEAARPVISVSDPGRISHIYIASYAASGMCGIAEPFQTVSRAIQTEFPSLRASYHGFFKTGGEALFKAIAELAEAQGDDPGDVVVIGAEKMTQVDAPTAAGILSQRENPHDRAYGATLPALGALVTRAYMREYGVPEEAFHAVAVKNHHNGSMNSKAHFRKTVTLDEVASSPLVADPLRRLHCAPISDGAAAVRLSTRDGAVTVCGWGRGMDAAMFQERQSIERFIATARASEAARRQAGVENGDINVVEIHDAFSPFELINLEEMGFFAPGAAWKALLAGQLDIGGRVAVNASGGMKAKGHPIGAAGLSSAVDMFDQLTGNAGRRQQEGARLGMIQSQGGVSDESFVFILEGA
jgi:acetyl-CoA C-acetyltransferase